MTPSFSGLPHLGVVAIISFAVGAHIELLTNACQVFSSPLRMAPRALSEQGVLLRMAPGFRSILVGACGESLDEDEANIHGSTELCARRL